MNEGLTSTSAGSPVLTGHKGFTVRGFAVRTENTDETDPSTARIPLLWQRYWGAGGPDAIPGTLDAPVTVAVYSDYETDHNGRYSLLVGSPALGNATSADHDSVTVPDGSYLLFEAHGPVPQALIDTWKSVHDYFSEDVPYRRTFAADFEIHDASSPDRIELYIAVR